MTLANHFAGDIGSGGIGALDDRRVVAINVFEFTSQFLVGDQTGRCAACLDAAGLFDFECIDAPDS